MLLPWRIENAVHERGRASATWVAASAGISAALTFYAAHAAKASASSTSGTQMIEMPN